MASSSSVKLGFHQLALQLELSDPTSNNKTRCSTAALPVPTTQKVVSVRGREIRLKTQTQALVDLLHHCAENRSVRETKAVHGHVLKSNFVDKDLVVLLNHVVHAYSKCSDFRAAREVFDEMPQRNVFTWTVMIVGSTERGFYHDGYEYFCEMRDCGIWPDAFAFSAILQLCIGLNCVDFGKMVHAHVVIRGFASHVFVNTSLLNMYMKLGDVEDSCKVFSTMTEHNEVSWNAVISGFTSTGHYVEAFNYFIAMKKSGFTPNMYTFISVLKAVGKLGDGNKCKEVHKCVSQLDMESNVLVGTALIDMYSNCGDLSNAISIFDMNFANCKVNMPWNAMISGYSQCGCSHEAVKVFVKMCENNVKSDVYTYCSVFNAIADLKNLKFSREAHGMVLKSGYDFMVLSVNNAIADAYSKCGSLEDVCMVFDRMGERDVVSWTTMLTAYSQRLEWEEALVIFCRMKKEGSTPNQFTFSSVFVACASLCFLEFGRQVHGLLFKAGRVGCLNEAFKFIHNMPIEPNDMVWQTLLGACRVHGNVELGEIAAKKILSIRPEYSATYVLLSNTYMETGSFRDGISLRNIMKERGVKKEPGCSWVSVDGEVHKFYAGDQHHPQKDQIYHMLEELKRKIKAMGYVPDMRHVLEDGD
ncbi:hypothetical protein U1Q18_022443 [Sarracenia purpurea var. burkii]